MATNNRLAKIVSCIADAYRELGSRLEEKQVEMSLDIISYGKPYLLYSFDKVVKNKKSGKAIDLQPYFKASKNVKSMCDYFLFCWDNSKLFVLLIELKQGEEQVSRQLDAGELFARYLINTFNRVEKTNYVPEIRKISIRNPHIVKKGTSIKSIIYNPDAFCTFYGSAFYLPEFLK